jgi:hypothetical protein
VKVACREDVLQGKLWAYSDPNRRSKRKKDELDLIRLAEAYPELKNANHGNHSAVVANSDVRPPPQSLPSPHPISPPTNNIRHAPPENAIRPC